MFASVVSLVFCFGIFVTGVSARVSDSQDGATKFKRQTGEPGCNLPPQPDFGTYTVSGVEEPPIPGKLVKSYSILKYKCNQNLIINAQGPIYCMEDGKWSADSIKCVESCPPLVSPSLNYKCFLNGVEVNCATRMHIGTRSDISCKTSYLPSAGSLSKSITCRPGGTWDTSDLICTAECGTVSTAATPYIINGVVADIGEFPWHVAIYDKKAGDLPKNICGGSIISSYVVVSAAHCFWNTKSRQGRSKEDFAIGYGKVYNAWNDTRDVFATYTDIKRLTLYPTYNDIETAYEEDIAIIVLKNIIEFNNVIKPVCVEWQRIGYVREIPEGTVGKVAGWGWSTSRGNPSDHVLQVSLPVVSKSECRENVPADFAAYIKEDKICASASGSNVCPGDSGGGFCFPQTHKNKTAYYLQALVSVAPSRDNECSTDHYTAFTVIFKYLPWLREMKVHKDPEVFKCKSGQYILLETACDGENDCADGSDESEYFCKGTGDSDGDLTLRFKEELGNCAVPENPDNGTYSYPEFQGVPVSNTKLPIRNGTVLKFKCNNGYLLTSLNDEIVCQNGQWSTPPRCYKPCPAIFKEYIQRAECQLDDKSVSCDNEMAVNSQVQFYCKSDNEPKNFKCQDDSTWSSSAIPCHPECGAWPKSLTKIVPWHAAIYEKKSGSTPEIICGGSVVNANTILTAAFCVWDNKGHKLKKKELISVGMGKVYKSWKDTREKHAVYSDVKAITYFEEQYYGFGLGNIAILILSTRIDLEHNSFIRPICIDWKNFNDISLRPNFQKEIVTGWNFDQAEESNGLEISHVDLLPTIEYDICRNQAMDPFKSLAGIDTLCGVKVNGVTICRENVGAGLAATNISDKTPLYYLEGMVSVGPSQGAKCDESFTLFTTLYFETYWKWLKQHKVNLGPAED